GGYYANPVLPAGLAISGSTGVISGTPTTPSAAKNYTVTGFNAGGLKTAVVNITVNGTALSTDAKLSGLTLSAGTLSPVFASSTVNYSATVANTITSLTITPITDEAHATVKVNGVAVVSGSASGSISLVVGANTITTVVTAQDGTTTATYTVTVTRSASSSATLSNLVISAGTLTPAFVPGTINYTASVPNATASITLTPTTTNSAATVKVNGITVASGSASGAIALAVGLNTITTVITAQDGVTTRTYTVKVTRAAATQSSDGTLSNLVLSSGTLQPVFSPSTIGYVDIVANSVSSITVTPTASNANATITVNGVAVASGATSASIALAIGSNTIKTISTSQDGTSIITYSVIVTRPPSSDATLSNLAISAGTLTPAFATGTTSYTASVTNATTSITVTPTLSSSTASVNINGTTVTSGSASGPIALAVGANTITAVVTAQDASTTKTYTITVTRAASSQSSDATLSSLVPSAGTLSPAFAAATTSYTASVANTVTSVTLTPTTHDAGATVKINGAAVASGAASQSLPLVVGPNTITTVVTAADGTTTKTYTVTITRVASANANLFALTLSNGTLSPVFVSGTLKYTASVASGISSITVTPTTTDPNAIVKVNGVTVVSGAASGPIALAFGANVINVVVTAQNGTATKTYTVTVTRTPSANANLTSIGPSVTPLSPGFTGANTNYTLSVANSVASITVKPISADPNATIMVNGAIVASNTVSGPIALPEGAVTTVTLTVTA